MLVTGRLSLGPFWVSKKELTKPGPGLDGIHEEPPPGALVTVYTVFGKILPLSGSDTGERLEAGSSTKSGGIHRFCPAVPALEEGTGLDSVIYLGSPTFSRQGLKGAWERQKSRKGGG